MISTRRFCYRPPFHCRPPHWLGIALQFCSRSWPNPPRKFAHSRRKPSWPKSSWSERAISSYRSRSRIALPSVRSPQQHFRLRRNPRDSYSAKSKQLNEGAHLSLRQVVCRKCDRAGGRVWRGSIESSPSPSLISSLLLWKQKLHLEPC